MITKDVMFIPLLAADPSFEPRWNAFCEEWQREADMPIYLALSELARHLIAKLELGSTENFDAVFDVVERWHVEGDHYVREAATIGFLEALSNANLHAKTAPVDFVSWLRPKSLRFWNKVEAFWSEGKIITGD